MKKGSFFFVIFAILLSCSHGRTICDDDSSLLSSSQATKGEKGEDILPDNYKDFLVTDADMEAYVRNLILERKPKGEEVIVESITPYAYNDVPVFYVIDFTDGWEIVSADKRGPIILGQGPTGSFKDRMTNEPLLAWVESLGGDILERRYDLRHEEEIEEREKELEQACLDQWASITADWEYIMRHLPQTKVIHDSITQPSGGQWVLINLES